MMLLCLTLAALLFSASAVIAEGPPRLIVQLVEPGWHPVPGVKVTVTPVVSCKTRKASGEETTVVTDETGYARFNVADDASYALTVKEEGGFGAVPQCVRLFPHTDKSPTAYVQIRLKVTAKPVFTHR